MKCGWTWAKKSDPDDWLQNEKDQDGNYTQRNMFAYLIHIRTEEDLNLN